MSDPELLELRRQEFARIQALLWKIQLRAVKIKDKEIAELSDLALGVLLGYGLLPYPSEETSASSQHRDAE